MLHIITTALKFYFKLSMFTRLQLAGTNSRNPVIIFTSGTLCDSFPAHVEYFWHVLNTFCTVIIVKSDSLIEKIIFLYPLIEHWQEQIFWESLNN